MESEGPVKLNVYEMRLAAMLIATPVPAVWSMYFGLIPPFDISKSLFIRPEKQTNKKSILDMLAGDMLLSTTTIYLLQCYLGLSALLKVTLVAGLGQATIQLPAICAVTRRK